ncbi:hypothetical protein AB4144_25055, partial [Rhizobiaceae sp. 2RAB30]
MVAAQPATDSDAESIARLAIFMSYLKLDPPHRPENRDRFPEITMRHLDLAERPLRIQTDARRSMGSATPEELRTPRAIRPGGLSQIRLRGGWMNSAYSPSGRGDANAGTK